MNQSRTIPRPVARPDVVRPRRDAVPDGLLAWLAAARDAAIRGGPGSEAAVFSLRRVAKIATEALAMRRKAKGTRGGAA